MVYAEIDGKIRAALKPIEARIAEIINRVETLRVAAPKEDSKSKEAAMREEIKQLKAEQRTLYGQQYQLREEAFKDLLAKEYSISRKHPKFEKLYAKCYELGHSAGYSEVENYFSDLIDLVL